MGAEEGGGREGVVNGNFNKHGNVKGTMVRFWAENVSNPPIRFYDALRGKWKQRSFSVKKDDC